MNKWLDITIGLAICVAIVTYLSKVHTTQTNNLLMLTLSPHTNTVFEAHMYA